LTRVALTHIVASHCPVPVEAGLRISVRPAATHCVGACDMLLERTIAQLDIGYVPDQTAKEMGHLGYLQWLGALKGNASYLHEAMRAYELARPFIENSPAVAVFCQLLVDSSSRPLTPLTLILPKPKRRGGAKARRGAL